MRHNEGTGVWTPDFSPPCTVIARNVPCSPIQGRCPCGSLAKRSDFRKKRRYFGPDRPDRRNPKFAERHDVPLVGLGGIPGPAARQNWLAERRNVSWKVAEGGHCLSAIFGLRRSGRLRPEDHRFSQVPPLFAKQPHGHMPCRGF